MVKNSGASSSNSTYAGTASGRAGHSVGGGPGISGVLERPGAADDIFEGQDHLAAVPVSPYGDGGERRRVFGGIRHHADPGAAHLLVWTKIADHEKDREGGDGARQDDRPDRVHEPKPIQHKVAGHHGHLKGHQHQYPVPGSPFCVGAAVDAPVRIVYGRGGNGT